MTRAFWILLKRELGAVLSSPLAYVIFTISYMVLGPVSYTHLTLPTILRV